MTRPEAVENRGRPNGIPETWLRSLADANKAFPVGSPIVCQAIAPVLFRSLITGDISVKELFNSELGNEQLHGLTAMGNKQHDEFKVDRRVKPENLSNRWDMDINYFADLVHNTLDWLNKEKFGSDTNPNVSDELAFVDRRSQEFTELLKDLQQKEKLGLVLRVLYKAVESTSNPESQKAAERHKFLLVNDAYYRKVQCANVALSPVYKNMRQAAEDEAVIIEQKKGVKIPGAILRWFYDGEVEKDLQRFL